MSDAPKKVFRIDVAGDVSGAKVLDNGYLRAPAYLSRTGIFEYRRADGTVKRELRPADEVFAPDALASFAMVPITDEHPPGGKLDSKSTRGAGTIGHVGEEIKPDGKFVTARVMITDDDAIQKITSGAKVQLSCGYVCDMDETPGVFEGVTYDAVQRNIRGNHVALVARGRAGSDVRVRLDNSDAIMVNDNCAAELREDPIIMKTIKLDGIDYEVSDPVYQALEKVAAKKDAELSEAKKVAEANAARADAAEAEVKKAAETLAAATDPAKVREIVKARVALERQAGEILGAETKIDELDDQGVRLAVLKKLSPEADLSSKSPDYVIARYDAAVELAAKAPAPALTVARTVTAPVRNDADAKPTTPDEAKRRFLAALSTAHLKKAN